MSGTILDRFLDENNNNWLRNIDNLPTTMNILPESTFTFKSNVMQCIDNNLRTDENDQNNRLMNSKLTKQSVKRALFVEKDEIDHEANLKLVRKQLEQLVQQDCEKWNFDFKNNCPLNNANSQYEWFIGKPVFTELIKTDVISNKNCDTIKNNETTSKSSKSDTRSLKRKLNINGKFFPILICVWFK
jgi:hypothetical protein